MGNPDAPVKLVEYGSLSCPHCAEFAEQGGAPLARHLCEERPGQLGIPHLSALPDRSRRIRCCSAARARRPSSALVEQLYADQRNWVGRIAGAAAASSSQLARELPPRERAADARPRRRASTSSSASAACPKRGSTPASPTRQVLAAARRDHRARRRGGRQRHADLLHQRREVDEPASWARLEPRCAGGDRLMRRAPSSSPRWRRRPWRCRSPAPPRARRRPPAARPRRDWTRTVVATPEGGFRMGNPNAPVKLVEYGSLTCRHCADFAPGRDAAAGRHAMSASGKVSYEYRNFILNGLDVAACPGRPLRRARPLLPGGRQALRHPARSGWAGSRRCTAGAEASGSSALPPARAQLGRDGRARRARPVLPRSTASRRRGEALPRRPGGARPARQDDRSRAAPSRRRAARRPSSSTARNDRRPQLGDARADPARAGWAG